MCCCFQIRRFCAWLHQFQLRKSRGRAARGKFHVQALPRYSRVDPCAALALPLLPPGWNSPPGNAPSPNPARAPGEFGQWSRAQGGMFGVCAGVGVGLRDPRGSLLVQDNLWFHYSCSSSFPRTGKSLPRRDLCVKGDAPRLVLPALLLCPSAKSSRICSRSCRYETVLLNSSGYGYEGITQAHPTGRKTREPGEHELLKKEK